MVCEVLCWWSPSTFRGEAQGPLRGGAGALLQGGCCLEEEAGEREEKKGSEAQGEASEEIAKVSAKGKILAYFKVYHSTEHSHLAGFTEDNLRLPMFSLG
mmetsp:Transcript_10647/g.23445  ORF Transcript_10647/g.23445 Transcript_10647/m.23445 type:complete len:100 (+) Transcript_10647:1086-1385(+)